MTRIRPAPCVFRRRALARPWQLRGLGKCAESKLLNFLSYRANSRVDPRRHKSYYAPSWSWASIIGPITFLTGRLDSNDKDQVSHIRKDGTTERVNRQRISLLEAVEIECTTDSLNPFGPPRHASLTARCQTVPVTWVNKKESANLSAFAPRMAGF